MMYYARMLSSAFVILFAFALLSASQPLSNAGAENYQIVDVVNQRDFMQTTFRTVNEKRGMHLGGVHVHKYGDGNEALYVYDSGNSRILAFLNPNWSSNNDLPDLVF